MASCSKKAIPLCIPDNCTWDSISGEFFEDKGKKREKLVLVLEALEKLRQIKEPVCVVSIAGTCRKGKSYILARAFDEDEVFPLGHSIDPETKGIWMWIASKKFKMSAGGEFTVVLLDSEGTDSIDGTDKSDNPIFTLMVLLGSVLVYNSQNVPTRKDLDDLEFIVNLSEKIQCTIDPHDAGTELQKRVRLSKTFPFFFWLFRDATLEMPEDCNSILEYLNKRIFNKRNASGNDEIAQQTANTIMTAFSGFDAFMLSAPTTRRETMKHLNDPSWRSKIDEEFLEGVEEFKRALHTRLKLKRAFNDGEYVSGEAMATLIGQYVDALNTPGAVPNIPKAWDVFVTKKCTEAQHESLELYVKEMKETLNGKLPCSDDLLAQSHYDAVRKSQQEFYQQVLSIRAVTVETYQSALMDKIGTHFQAWKDKNRQQSEKSCSGLVEKLQLKHFKPILTQLERNAPELTAATIFGALDSVRRDYESKARGSEEVQRRVFAELQPKLNAQLNSYVKQLEQLKDYDKKLMEGRIARAKHDAELARLKMEAAEKEQAIRIKEREMKLLKEKHENDTLQQKLQHEQRLREQQESANNMTMANMQEQLTNLVKIREEDREKEEKRRGEQQKWFQELLDKQWRTYQDQLNNQLQEITQEIGRINEDYKAKLEKETELKEQWQTKAIEAGRDRDVKVAAAQAEFKAEKDKNQYLKGEISRKDQENTELEDKYDRMMKRGVFDRLRNKRV